MPRSKYFDVQLTYPQYTTLRAVSRGGLIDPQSDSVLMLQRYGLVAVKTGASPQVTITGVGTQWLAANPKGGPRRASAISRRFGR